jgi:hypothetical protein
MFSAVTPSGKLIKFGEFPAPEWKRDQFSYLVKEAFVTPKLMKKGCGGSSLRFRPRRGDADEGDLGANIRVDYSG